MDIKIFAAAALAATSLSLTSCNDDFLEKIPKTDLTAVSYTHLTLPTIRLV